MPRLRLSTSWRPVLRDASAVAILAACRFPEEMIGSALVNLARADLPRRY